jgi:hypothetical protein
MDLTQLKNELNGLLILIQQVSDSLWPVYIKTTHYGRRNLDW